MAGVEMKFKEENDDEDDDEFIRNDKVISIVNLLNKYKIKLWEMPNFESVDASLKIDVIMSSFEVVIFYRYFELLLFSRLLVTNRN